MERMGYGARERRKAKRAIAREYKLPMGVIKCGDILTTEQEDNLHKAWKEASAKHANTKAPRTLLAQNDYAKKCQEVNADIARHATEAQARRIKAHHAA